MATMVTLLPGSTADATKTVKHLTDYSYIFTQRRKSTFMKGFEHSHPNTFSRTKQSIHRTIFWHFQHEKACLSLYKTGTPKIHTCIQNWFLALKHLWCRHYITIPFTKHVCKFRIISTKHKGRSVVEHPTNKRFNELVITTIHRNWHFEM